MRSYTNAKGKLFTVLGLAILCLALFSLSGCTPKKASHKLLINELMAVNTSGHKDEDGKYEDWVEIYNPGKKPVDIGGMYFSGSEKNLQKFQIPTENATVTTIQPGGFLILFFDKDLEEGILHTDIKLDRAGEILYLTDSDGETLIDRVEFGPQTEDISYGRSPDGAEVFSFFNDPSPGKSNGKANVTGYAAAPSASSEGGFINSATELSFVSRGEGEIWYTLDGSAPEKDRDQKYTGPIKIDSSMVVRARAYESNLLPSPITTRTFLLNEDFDFPVICLSIDPADLWDKEKGFYRKENIWKDWERPCHVEFFDPDNSKAFGIDLGASLSGGYSKRSPKRSFNLRSRAKYGQAKIHHKLFQDKDIDVFDGFIVRADAMFGLNAEPLEKPGTQRKWAGERIKNELLYEVNKKFGNSVDMQALEPCILFVNNEYWGLFTLTERKGEHFLKSNFGAKKLDILNPWEREVVSGNFDHYEYVEEFIEDHDLRDPVNYDSVKNWIDIPNWVDAWFFEAYISKGDINLNSRIWRDRATNGKFRTFSYDQDHWKTYRFNMTEKLMDYEGDSKTYLFHLLHESPEFHHYQINRWCDIVNGPMHPDTLQPLIEEIYLRTAEAQKRDQEHWGDSIYYVKEREQVEWLKKYARKRPKYIRRHMKNWWELGGYVDLTVQVNDPSKGYIKVSTLNIHSSPWTGTYIQNIPIIVEAIPKNGAKFKGWEDQSLPKNAKLELNLSQEVFGLKAIFE